MKEIVIATLLIVFSNGNEELAVDIQPNMRVCMQMLSVAEEAAVTNQLPAGVIGVYFACDAVQPILITRPLITRDDDA